MAYFETYCQHLKKKTHTLIPAEVKSIFHEFEVPLVCKNLVEVNRSWKTKIGRGQGILDNFQKKKKKKREREKQLRNWQGYYGTFLRSEAVANNVCSSRCSFAEPGLWLWICDMDLCN